MSSLKTEVESRTDAFEKAFLSLDHKKAKDFFNIPMIFVSDMGVHSFEDEPSLVDFLKLYMSAIKDRGYRHVDLIVKNVDLLNASHAAVTFEVERKDKTGQTLPSLDGTLALIKDEDWRIVVASLLDHTGHEPLKHGSKQGLSLDFVRSL